MPGAWAFVDRLSHMARSIINEMRNARAERRTKAVILH